MESKNAGGMGARPNLARSVTKQVASESLLFAAHWFGARRFDKPKERKKDLAARSGTVSMPNSPPTAVPPTLTRGFTSRMVPESLREEVMLNFLKKHKPPARSGTFSQTLMRGFTRSASQPPSMDQGGSSTTLGAMPKGGSSFSLGGGDAPTTRVQDVIVEGDEEDDDWETLRSTSKVLPSNISRPSQRNDDTGLDGMLHATVSGSLAVEQLLWQFKPIFTISQLVLAFGAWALLPLFNPDSANDARSGGAGLESLWPGDTAFLLQRDCTDLRYQCWRWLTYQFTHASFTHILGNSVMLFIVAIPLEGFHGHLRLALLLNVGVAVGAAFDSFLQNSYQLVGMSAGVYALMGMHYADVIMNWGQMEYRYGKSALLLVLILIDSIAAMVSEFSGDGTNISHAAHFGGWLSGMLMGVLVGRNLKVHDFEHYFQAVAFVILLVIVIFSAVWLSGWPPRTIFQAEQDAWCWVRQVYNTSLFQSNNWQCVFCSTEACTKSWATQRYIELVSVDACFANQ